MHQIQKYKKKNGTCSYTACIRLKGYPTMTATFDKKQHAVLWIQENETKMKQGLHIQTSESKKHTLEEAIDRFLTHELPKRKADVRNIEMKLKWWKNRLGKYYLYSITPALLTEVKEQLETEPAIKPTKNRKTRTGATVNRYLNTLSIVLNFASNEWGWLNENPMHKVRKNKEKAENDRYLTLEEINALLSACKNIKMENGNYNEQTFLFVLIALTTGARFSEIKKLTWATVDLKNKMFYFLNTKNGESRGVPMVADVYNALIEFQKVRNINNKSLWVTADGKNLINMRTRFAKALKMANIENCRFHDLRHTVASYIAMNGGSTLDIAQVTGHKSMQVLKRYTHYTKSYIANKLQETVNNMFSEVENI